MKLQYLMVIFAIIIIPISAVISVYMQTQIKAIDLQTSYDNVLNNATYDAIRAFQLNETNSNSQQDITTEKMRDIEASINSFYHSLATSFGVSGYTEEDLNPFIPAIVYTLYDGYYIYSPYKDIQTGEMERGLKPYIYYSERYQKGSIDIVVNYTLDNYITIYGTDKNGNYVTRSGYLINPEDVQNNGRTYKGITIAEEHLSEITDGSYQNNAEEVYVYIGDSTANVGDEQKRREKAYKEAGTGKWYKYSTDQKKIYLTNPISELDESAISYYKEAKEFSEWVRNNFGTLRISDIQTEQKEELGLNGPDSGKSVFNVSNSNDPETESSVFNNHRRDVMKTSIETNLVSAIASYNEISKMDGNTYSFRMPKLLETDWDKILHNVTLITFMQGIPIKYKYYSGYSIVTNNENREYVDSNQFFFVDGNEYHKMSHLENKDGIVGYRNVDFIRKKVYDSNNVLNYYYPHLKYACYDCVVSPSNDLKTKEEILTENPKIKQAYYTALARERYNNYKSNRMY